MRPVATYIILLAGLLFPPLLRGQGAYEKSFESFLFSMESRIHSMTADGNSIDVKVKVEDAKLTLSEDERYYEGTGTITHVNYDYSLPPECTILDRLLQDGTMNIRVEVDEFFDAPPDVRIYVAMTQATFPREGSVVECVTPNGPQQVTFDPQPIWGSGFVSLNVERGNNPVAGKGFEVRDVKVEGWSVTGLEDENFRVYRDIDYQYTDPQDGTVITETTQYELKPCLEYTIDYEMGRETFTFANSGENIWPERYWSGINYSLEDSTFKALTGDPESNRFPDWYSFVRAFGEHQAYLSTFPKVYNQRALIRWKSWSGTSFGGACYGFAYSSLLHYCGFRSVLPQPLGALQPDDAVREEIIAKYLYQFSAEGAQADARNRGQTPKQMVAALIENFRKDGTGNSGLAIVLPGYGHEIVPLRIKRCFKEDDADIITYIDCWDNNEPATPRQLRVNETKNRVIGGSGEYSRGFYADARADEFAAPFPGLRKQGSASYPALAADGVSEVYHTGSGTAELAVAGQPSVDLNAAMLDSDPDFYPLIGKTGTIPVVPGYMVSGNGAQPLTVQLSSAGGDDAVSFIDSGMMCSAEVRAAAGAGVQALIQPGQGAVHVSSDGAAELRSLLLLRSEDGADYSVLLGGLTFDGADSLDVRMGSGREILHLRNPGKEKHYTLQLMKSSNRFESSGTFGGLEIAEGSSQSIRVGSSDSLATTRIELLVDTDSDGSTDEVIVLRGDAATAIDRPAVISDDLHAWPVPWHPDEGPLSIRYSLRRESTARLIVYNTLQQVVAELVPAQRHYAGSAYTATWNGRDAAGTPVPSGTYFYVLEAASGSRAVGKVAVLR